jgi:transposase
MVETGVDVPTMSDVDTSRSNRRNKRWPEALKREIVAATLIPGASVSVVARQYDVNANQVFSWRRRYGEASKPPGVSPSTSGLVPVTIAPELLNVGTAPAPPATSEMIEIEVSGDYRVRVGSGFDGRVLKRVLDVLRKR